MIVAENPKPSIGEFRELMTKIDVALNSDALNRAAYYVGRNGTQLETDVRDAAVECAKNTKFEGSIQLVSGLRVLSRINGLLSEAQYWSRLE